MTDGEHRTPRAGIGARSPRSALRATRRAVRERIKEMLEARLAGHHETVVWPGKTAEVPHDDPRFLVAYMPLESAGEPKAERQRKAKEFFEQYGDRPRRYKNGLALAIPAIDQIEILRRAPSVAPTRARGLLGPHLGDPRCAAAKNIPP